MWKKLFGFGKKDVPKVEYVDPKDVLFSLPTLCEQAPEILELAAPMPDARMIHEDDWRQIEFVPRANADHIARSLVELAAFKQLHQASPVGWAKMYLRPEHPVTLASMGLPPKIPPGLTACPLTVREHGFIEGGFALADTSDWFVYGQRIPGKTLLHIAVSPGASQASPRICGVDLDLRAIEGLAACRLVWSAVGGHGNDGIRIRLDARLSIVASRRWASESNGHAKTRLGGYDACAAVCGQRLRF